MLWSTCPKSFEKTKAKIFKARARNKAKKAKAKIIKPDSPKANFDLTLPEGYENSSTDSQSSTCKRSPAKVSDISKMLPNSSSSDVSFKHGSKQTSTHSKGVSTETIDYPENEVINIIEKIKLAKDSENAVQGFISKDTNFRSNQSQEQFLFDTEAGSLVWKSQKTTN